MRASVDAQGEAAAHPTLIEYFDYIENTWTGVGAVGK
jgi:hypothetical protein